MLPSPIPEIALICVSVLGVTLFIGHLLFGYFDNIRKNYRIIQLGFSSYAVEHTIWFGTVYSKLWSENYESEQEALRSIQRHKERQDRIAA